MTAQNISLVGLNKAAVLAALYNASRPQGMGFLHYDPAPMTVEQAQKIIGDGADDLTAMFGHRVHGNRLYFDYLKGRVMKVDLSGDELDPWGYDRDNGQGTAQRVIDGLRKEGDTNSVDIQAIHDVSTRTAAKDVMNRVHEETAIKKDGGVTTVTLGLADAAQHLIPKVEKLTEDE